MPAAALVTRVSRSARWALVESLVSASASTLTVIALARLLGTAEFGAAGMAMAVAAIVQALLLGGMPDAVARARSVHTAHTDAAFWAMTGLGALVSLLCLAIGAGVALAGQPRLGALVAVQGLAGIAVGAAAVPTGLLLRKLRTRALVGRTAWSKFAGLGAWAMVIGAVFAQVAATAQLLLTMRRPRWRRHDAQLRETLRIGLLSGAQASLGTLTTRGFLLAFGAVYGLHAVGVFNFALRLVEEAGGLVITSLRRVTVSAFAAAKRSGGDLAPLFARGTSIIAYLAAPLFLGAAAVAGDAVPLVFGARWNAAVPVVQLMLAMWLVRALRMLVNAT
ncbi:MAG: oligosaccharide flippase family protein, partial [Polymorphobacter sp.]